MRFSLQSGAAALALSASIAVAQTPAERREAPAEEVPRGQTVMERPRPDYDPLGVRLGGFLFHPGFAVRQEFNSNVFATQRNRISDFITVLQPSFNLQSDWNNHSLGFYGGASIGRYWDETNENYEDFTLGTSGRLDVTRDTQLFGALSYRLLHEERSSPDDVGGREPTRYSIASAMLGAQHRLNRLAFRLDGTADRYRFRNTKAFGGGSIDQSGRDRDQFGLKLRTSYEFAPLREVYLLTGVNKRRYQEARDNAGFDRDSKGFEIAAGILYDLTGVTFLDLFVGYSEQDYQDRRLKTARGVSGGLKLIWNVTRLTTVTGLLSREIEETTQLGASSYFATKSEVRIDHELQRNVIVSGHVGYQNDDFEGIRRDDDYYRVGVGARYLINRNFSAEGGYTFRKRDSNVTNADFNENVIYLRLSGRL